MQTKYQSSYSESLSFLDISMNLKRSAVMAQCMLNLFVHFCSSLLLFLGQMPFLSSESSLWPLISSIELPFLAITLHLNSEAINILKWSAWFWFLEPVPESSLQTQNLGGNSHSSITRLLWSIFGTWVLFQPFFPTQPGLIWVCREWTSK